MSDLVAGTAGVPASDQVRWGTSAGQGSIGSGSYVISGVTGNVLYFGNVGVAALAALDTAGDFGVAGALHAGAGGINPQWFNVKDYGAVGNGSHDDGAAIVSAFTAAKAAADAAGFTAYPSLGGFAVYFPPGIYASSSSITMYENVSVLSFGGATVQAYGSTVTDCFVFGDGNYLDQRYALPSVINFTRGAAVHFQPKAVYAHVSIEHVENCQAGFLFQSNGGSGGNYDHTVQFGAVRGCTYGIQLQALGNGAGDYIQGLTVRGNAMVDNVNALYFTGLAGTTVQGFNSNDISVSVVDGNNVTNGSGITYDSATFYGGNAIRFNQFGPFQSKFIQATNGGACMMTQFEGGLYDPSHMYDRYDGLASGAAAQTNHTNGNRFRNVLDEIARAAAYTATSTSNSRSSFNGNVPITQNSFQVAFSLPAMSTGQVADFYVYSPFTTGSPYQVKFYPTNFGYAAVVCTACEDESITVGSDGNGGVPNQIHIRLVAIGTVTAGQVVYGRAEVGL